MRKAIARDQNQRKRAVGSQVANWVNLVDINEYKPAIWLDASDAATITSSGSPARVSQWNDKSVNGFHLTQATSSLQPQTGVNTVNNLNVLTFNNIANEFLSRANVDILNFLNNGTDVMFFSVGVLFSGLVNWPPLTVYTATQRVSFDHRGTWYFDVVNAGGGRLSQAVAMTVDVPEVWWGYREGATMRMFKNRTQAGGTKTNASGTATTELATVSAGRPFGDNSHDMNGTLAEVIVIPGYSAKTFSAVGEYLFRKWGAP